MSVIQWQRALRQSVRATRDAPPRPKRETPKVKLRYSLRSVFLLTTVIAVLLAIPKFWPRQIELTINSRYMGFYHGLGLYDGPGYFGRDYYRIVVTEPGEGYWEVDFNGLGYNSYRGFYPDGTLRERGTCLVYDNGSDIAPDRTVVLNGEYFSPDGKLLSKIENGTGEQILCYPDGQPSWELELKDGKRTRVRMWHPNGQLALEETYRDDRVHGDYIRHYPNGQIRRHGQYTDGEQTGTWISYREDGSVEETDDYTTDTAASAPDTP